MRKKTEFEQKENQRQQKLLDEGVIFESAKGMGYWSDIVDGKQTWKCYPHILKHTDSLMNLFGPIRNDAINYFETNNISWWRQEEDRYFPTGNIRSSQIHCLNHLFALRKDKEAILALIQAINPEIIEILPSPVDAVEYEFVKGKPKILRSYLSFEFTINNITLLRERYDKRGARCTSIDVFVYAKDRSGKFILIPIEWKYTEHYEPTAKNKASTWTVRERYLPLVGQNSALSTWDDSYYWDPFYELARQTLLMEQIMKTQTICADDFMHILVCPQANLEMRQDANAFRSTLRKDRQSKFHIVDPQELLEPLNGKEAYKPLMEYLRNRYSSE